MVVLNVSHRLKRKEIIIETKGIFDKENLYFAEKYEGDLPSEVQVENFTQTCFIRWKVIFQRCNIEYVNSLYNRKLIGFKNVD